MKTRTSILISLGLTLIPCYFYMKQPYETKSEKKIMKVSGCDCKRYVDNINDIDDENMKRENYSNISSAATCSETAKSRGKHQKVITFSYYEKNPRMRKKRLRTETIKPNPFLDGIRINIDLLHKFYPEFTIRLYHNTSKDDPLMTKLCQYSCQNDFVDLCYINQDQKNVFPMLWRFFPTLDPNVDLIMSRDLDSRFTAREAAAVREWLASNKTLHAMRDHPYHGVPIMGGGWGSKLDTPKRRNNWKKSWSRIWSDSKVHTNVQGKGADQDLLKAHVWNTWAREDSLHHDSYTCHRFPGSTGWPSQRLNTTKYNYFGAVGPVEFMKICPINCRRKGHEEDWIYC